MNFEDIRIVALTIYGEARGQTTIGQEGVAWTIRNRTEDRRWPNTYSGVCKQKKQFSCWNKGEVNNHPMLVVDLSDPVFQTCYAIAAGVMAGLIPDRTSGANHYHSIDMKTYPYWADGSMETGRLGRHVFYKL